MARYSFSGPIPPKFKHKLCRHKQCFGKIALWRDTMANTRVFGLLTFYCVLILINCFLLKYSAESIILLGAMVRTAQFNIIKLYLSYWTKRFLAKSSALDAILIISVSEALKVRWYQSQSRPDEVSMCLLWEIMQKQSASPTMRRLQLVVPR